jgi:hypothetical protein
MHAKRTMPTFEKWRKQATFLHGDLSATVTHQQPYTNCSVTITVYKFKFNSFNCTLLTNSALVYRLIACQQIVYNVSQSTIRAAT